MAAVSVKRSIEIGATELQGQRSNRSAAQLRPPPPVPLHSSHSVQCPQFTEQSGSLQAGHTVLKRSEQKTKDFFLSWIA